MDAGGLNNPTPPAPSAVLDYAGTMSDQPIESRFQLILLSNGVRFAAPPAGWEAARREIKPIVVIVTIAGILVAAMLLMGLPRSDWLIALLGVAGFAVILIGVALLFLWQIATRPVILEVSGGLFQVRDPRPPRRYHHWPASAIARFVVHSTPGRARAVLRAQSVLGVGRTVLHSDNVDELRWMAAELNQALGRGRMGQE